MPPKKKKKMSRPRKRHKALGITFRSAALLEAALTHPSYRHETGGTRSGLENFDRLEFLGDAVLNLIICRELYRRFPQADEGTLSRLRSILVSRKILARIAAEIKFGRLLKTGPSISKGGAQPHDKVLADGFEAFLAAVYFDRGEKAVSALLLKLFRPYLDEKRLLRLDPNPKSTLQEWCQKLWQKLPAYEYRAAPEGAWVEITVDNRLKASASGRSRRDAEERAARTLLRTVRQDFAVSAAGRAKASSGRKLRKG